ncbi:MAG TPA: transporter substrate-binding domain-containing protein [Candidatus Faecalibacterium faecigallinarum]|uniref:Transporter substrate-binding domain-containing protein n=1 Tax=Candidatus Faecalibacterium faecigallinarum TaxID=2838577 RepID=A0A9D2P5G4_9FIRM|nr:transporter substrate-binding domain-containing protein [Candidatus Faecalibacterium faecigallinarum]
MKKITRRSFLAAAGLSAALALTACSSTSSSTAASASSTASEAASSAASGAASEASTQAIQSLEDLNGKTVGVQLGTTGDLMMSEEVGKADGLNLAGVEQYSKAADAVQALLTNKIDAVCIDDQVAKNFVAANPDELTMLDTAYSEESYAIAVSKDNPELTEKLNSAIAELKEDGTLDAILNKYIAKEEGATGYVSPEGTEYPNGTLVMATNAAFDPYEYIENGEIVGIDAEFAKALCDKLGYDLEIEDMEFDSIIAAVVSGKADFGMAGMTVTPEREEQIDFTDTYCTAAQNIIVLK